MPYSVKKRYFRKTFLAASAAVFVVAVVALYFTNHLPLLHRHTTAPISASSATKGEKVDRSGASSSRASSSAEPPATGQAKNSDDGTNSNATLVAPSGNFVSNHHPNLSGSPSSNALVSSCTTTPGATCQISFTKGGVTKSLPAETTDAGGTAYWNNWKLQDYGITEGSWTITATAKLGSQIKAANDAIDLVVSS